MDTFMLNSVVWSNYQEKPDCFMVDTKLPFSFIPLKDHVSGFINLQSSSLSLSLSHTHTHTQSTCLRTSLDSWDMPKNKIASFPVMRPSRSNITTSKPTTKTTLKHEPTINPNRKINSLARKSLVLEIEKTDHPEVPSSKKLKWVLQFQNVPTRISKIKPFLVQFSCFGRACAKWTRRNFHLQLPKTK